MSNPLFDQPIIRSVNAWATLNGDALRRFEKLKVGRSAVGINYLRDEVVKVFRVV
jgi:hypothetical protein